MLEVLEPQQQEHLKVLSQVQKSSYYEIEKLEAGYAKVVLRLENVQTNDDGTTVFEGDIFRVANFTALASVNEPHTFVISASVEFLSQIEISSEEITLEAKSLSSSLGKKFVEVRAQINDITIFMGNFTVIRLDNRSKIKV